MRESIYQMQPVVDKARELLENGTPIYFFDLETTGLSPVEDRILSFSALKYIMDADGRFEEVDRMDHFINPGFHIPEMVTEINHISDERVAGCDDEETAAPKIRAFLGEHPFVAGYNSERFDEGFMKAMYNRVFGEDFVPVHHLDVYKMSKEKLDIPSHKLSAVAEALGTNEGLEFHNSIDDVIATVRTCILLLDKYPKAKQCRALRRLNVKSASYWTRSHTLQRVYVQTVPYTKTYYDVYKQEWICDMENVDLTNVRQKVCEMYRVPGEKELVRTLLASTAAATTA